MLKNEKLKENYRVRFTPRQRARILLHNIFGIGPDHTKLAMRAEVADKHLNIPEELHPSPLAMAVLLEKVFRAKTPEDKHKLLAEPVPYGVESDAQRPELWFDYIGELTSKDIVRTIPKAARDLLPPGKVTWDKVADLGCGVGALSSALLGDGKTPSVVGSLTMVDQSPTLLEVVKKRYGARAEPVKADVTEMPFQDGAFDLMTSAGLVYSLGEEMQAPYFKEVSRVLKPGGIYLDGDYHGKSKYSRGVEERATTERWQLEWSIAKRASKEGPFDPLQDVDQETFFKQFGLKLSHKDYTDEKTENQVRIRVLEKAQ